MGDFFVFLLLLLFYNDCRVRFLVYSPDGCAGAAAPGLVIPRVRIVVAGEAKKEDACGS